MLVGICCLWPAFSILFQSTKAFQGPYVHMNYPERLKSREQIGLLWVIPYPEAFLSRSGVIHIQILNQECTNEGTPSLSLQDNWVTASLFHSMETVFLRDWMEEQCKRKLCHFSTLTLAEMYLTARFEGRRRRKQERRGTISPRTPVQRNPQTHRSFQTTARSLKQRTDSHTCLSAHILNDKPHSL